jgi:hypothetical protein
MLIAWRHLAGVRTAVVHRSMRLPHEGDDLERAQLQPLGGFDLRASLVVLHSSQDDSWLFCCRDTARRL